MHAYAHLNRIHRLRIDFSTTANAFEELLKKQAQNPTNDRLRQIITFVFFLRLGYVPCSCQKQQSRRPHQTQSRNLLTTFFSFGAFAALAKAFAGNEF